jgi:hypothetical protein
MDALMALILVVPVTVWGAYVEKTLWWWFFVPLGLPAIGMAHAYGLSTFLACASGALSRSAWRKNSANEKPTVAIVWLAVGFTIALLAGWISHWFMVRP